MNQLKKLSYWALLNPFLSQSSLVVAQLLLTFLAILIGIRLFVMGVFLPREVLYLGIGLCLLAFAFYPIRRSRFRFWRSNFTRQKTMDFALIFSGFLITLTLSNRDAFSAYRVEITQNEIFKAQNIVFSIQKEEIESKEQTAVTTKNINQPKPKGLRAWKKELRQQYRTYLKERKTQSSTEYDGGMVVLGIFEGLFIGALAAAISCSISCSGSGAGAGAALAVGMVVAILVGIMIARTGAKRKGNYQPMPKEKPKS